MYPLLSSSKAAAHLSIEESTYAFFWYERVNTASNIADIPSRDPSLCSGLGERVLCDLDAIRSELSDMP